jgi:dTMP kinase
MTEKSVTSSARFIAFEGVDGAGKGVQTHMLLAAMQDAGLPVILTREPGGSEGAEAIRKLIVEGKASRWDDITELLLIYAARRSHLRDTIWPSLALDTWVISDRFADSSRAFQGVAGQLGLDFVESIHEKVVGDFKPDLTIVLDLDPEVSLERAASRGGKEDRFEQKGLSYQQRVREGFTLLVKRSPDTHVLIDASGTRDNVSKAVLSAVNARLGLSLTMPGRAEN